MDWRETLRQILIGYFGDQSLEEGIDMMLFVAEDYPQTHQEFLAAFDGGIAAAARNDESIVGLIIDSRAVFVENPAEAVRYLEQLRPAYLTRYEQAVGEESAA